jgi:glycosyltransferase involved in cell wall biosynthesis
MPPTVHCVLPNDIDDPRSPSGGNHYDRRVLDGLAARGWTVAEHPVRGSWPDLEPGSADRLGRVMDEMPEGSTVLVDGLVASTAAEVLVPASRRVRLVVLVHMPLGSALEAQTLAAASMVVTTSQWTRSRLLGLHPLAPDRVRVASPGVDPAPLASGSTEGTRLLYVAAVTPHKGHDRLVAALAMVADRAWTCVCVGPLDRDPAYVQRLRRDIRRFDLTGRIDLTGPRTGSDLDARYAEADLLVFPSRGETYGMVAAEALARGIPVLASAVGGLPEAIGHAPDGTRPAILVPPGDPVALADALLRWLDEPEVRTHLRRSAAARRSTVDSWSVAVTAVSQALIDAGTHARTASDRAGVAR